MLTDDVITGRYVRLRSVLEEDAEFTLEIRQDREKNRFLHKVENSLDRQAGWIKKQQETEGDYFLIAETLGGKPVGTVGIYDIQSGTGHLGRLLMVGNPFQTVEAVMLAAKWAYEALGLSQLYGDVHVDNKPSLNISEAIGFHFGEPVYEEELDSYVRYGYGHKEEFPKYEEKIKKLIYREDC